MSGLGSCSSCGQEFHRVQRENKCPSCRRPGVPFVRNYAVGAALSRRDTQIQALLFQGCANKEIGAALHLTEATIKVYVYGLLRKLGVSTCKELMSRRIQELELEVKTLQAKAA